MTQPEHDEEFERFLERRSPLHERLSRADGAEPSAEVDRLVLARAKEALASDTSHSAQRSRRWAIPLSLAATLVIGVAVVLNVDRERVVQEPALAAALERASPTASPAIAESAGAARDATASSRALALPPAEHEERATLSGEDNRAPVLTANSSAIRA